LWKNSRCEEAPVVERLAFRGKTGASWTLVKKRKVKRRKKREERREK
jgi:hypothetical protein